MYDVPAWTPDTTENQVMARKRQPAEKKPMPNAEPKLKSIRLDLSEEDHHALRKAAADVNKSMAAYARQIVSEAVKAYRPWCKREGVK